MAAKYEAGATVYELAAEFDCHRTTVAERLKKAGIEMRLQSPTPTEGVRWKRVDGCSDRTMHSYLYSVGRRSAPERQ